MRGQDCAYRAGNCFVPLHGIYCTGPCSLEGQGEVSPRRTGGNFSNLLKKPKITHAVKIAAFKNPYEYLRNVQDSPTKSIDHKHKNSVALLERKQCKQIIAVTLDGMMVYNTVGSLAQLAKKSYGFAWRSTSTN
jgi:hypothetical protein